MVEYNDNETVFIKDRNIILSSAENILNKRRVQIWQVVFVQTKDLYQNAAFNRCVDFLARMIEKYGCDISLQDDISQIINEMENNEVA